MFKWFFLFLTLLRAAPLPPEVSVIQLGVSRNRTVQGVVRAAVANAKIAKVRSLSPDRILITGMKSGKTSVRLWNAAGVERELAVTVVPSELYETFSDPNANDVVKVALEFLEVDDMLTRDVGVHWPEAIHFSASGTAAGTGFSGVNYTLVFSSAKAWIAHLVQEGWAKTLANPDLYVRLGEEAIFHSGGELPVATSSENYGRYQRHVEWKPYGLTVKVRPQSGDRVHIRSEIDVEISEVNSSYVTDGVPSLTKRDLKTKMNSMEGETVILSGLVRQASAVQKNGIPLLGSLPLLGILFSERVDRGGETEVFMAVTFSLMTRSRNAEQLDRFRTNYQRGRP